ncbi:MAG: rhomboid family intramembrane serine protease [Bacteroidota bacterium]
MNGESPLDRFRRWYNMLPPALRLLMTVNTVLFLAWFILQLVQPAAEFVVDYLALNTALPTPLFRPWQLLSYSVLHLDTSFLGLITFAFDMLWLYWMGRDYEETFGSHRLFGLYVLAAVGGALLAVFGGATLGGSALIYGSMSAVFGVLCCVATLYPNRGIGLFLLGVVPLKWLAIGFLALLVLTSLRSPAYVLLYLGGAGIGFLFAKAQQNGTDLAAWAQVFFPSRTERTPAPSGEKSGMFGRLEQWLARRSKDDPKPARSSASRASDPPRRAKRRPRPAAPPPAGPADVDRILDKISERGYDALTEEEKRILIEASEGN